jgi:MaoC like domain
MFISFDADAVKKWANFSGDHNPIHFDMDAATKVTDEGLVVHGMLVLLPVKQMMTEDRDELPSVTRQWTRLQSSFRQPVPHLRNVEVRVTRADHKAKYTVLREDRQMPYLQGMMSRGMPPEVPLPGDGTVFDRKDLLQRWDYFRGSFPDINSTWIFIDALLFSAFVERDASDLIAAVTGELAPAQHHKGKFRFVVQTSQCVWFDQTFLQTLAVPQDSNLSYRYARGEWMADGDRVIGRVGLEARMNDRRILHSDVGLLLQSSP